MKNKKHLKVFGYIVLLLVVMLVSENYLKAASPITVHNQTELESAVNDAQENISIEFAENFEEELTSQINFYIDHQYDIVVDGKGKKLFSPTLVYERHINLYIENDNKVTFKNMTLEGNAVLDNNDEPIYGQSPYGGLYVSGNDPAIGQFNLENVIFNRIHPNDSAPFVSNYIGNVQINSVSFTRNICEGSSSISATQIKDFLISDSEFIKNINTSQSGSGYFKGNIKLMEIRDNITVKNTLFDENKTASSYGSSGAALSISLYDSETKVKLSNNIFKNNDTDFSSGYQVGKGGAVGIDGIGQNKIIIENSLFTNNHAGASGSAVFLEAQQNNNSATSNNIIISNSTFTKNHSSLLSPESISNSSGGVIHMENDSGKFMPKIYQNTIIDNSATFNYDEDFGIDEETIINKYGIGVSAETYDQSIIIEPEIKGNIILANKLIKSDGQTEVSSARLNVNLSRVTQSNNIGFDNGSPTDKTHTLNNVFGFNQVSLKNNNGLSAGIDNNKEIIKSFMILPSANTMGIADNSSIPLVETDQRLKTRSTTQPDIGAVEIGSIKYDANGGAWKLPKLDEYKDGLFYEGENPNQIFFATSLGNALPAIDDSNLKKLDSTFLGWSKDKDATTADLRPNENVVANEQTILYAVWNTDNFEDRKVVINFDKNADDALDGEFNKLTSLKGKSLQEQNLSLPTPTRNGYKLMGWSTSSSNTKVNFNVETIVSGHLKVYAVWKKNKQVDMKVTINFDKNAKDAQDGKFNKLTVLKGYSMKEQNLNLPTPSRKGYKLIGWSLSSQSNKNNFSINTKISKNMKVYAVWKKNNYNSLLPKTGYNITLLIISLLATGLTYYYRKSRMSRID